MKITTLLFTFLVCNGYIAFGQLIPTYDDIMIPMRDNEFLEVDVYIPTGVDSAQVILIQTPYNKDNFAFSLPMGVGQNLDSQPFIWVIADWRGFYGSSGANTANVDRGEDGFDICEWIVAQVWHKDKIGTWGPSALGGVQYHTAREHHPNHTCAVPMVAHPQQSYDSYFYGGVLEEARLQQLDALGYGLSPIILANTYYNTTWQFAEAGSWYPQDIHIPTLQIGGWYDHNIDKMMDWYEATRNSALVSVQDQQWLLVGPWVHGGTGAAYVGSSIQGELLYPNAEFVSDTMAWDFFMYYLQNVANDWDNTDLITYYEMGTDTWNTSNAATIDIPSTDILYLNQSNSLISGMGSSNTSFISDPNNPAPTIGGATLHSTLDQGPYDQISLASRNDIITFESNTLSGNVHISGEVTLDLYVEADQPDCDIVVQLVDVYPDGRNMLVTEGTHRMRFRNGYAQADEVFMTPGQVYPVTVSLPFTNYTWLNGHKIKVYIGGNSSTRWNVNLQDGGTMYQPGTGNIANITIHHDATYPSKINLPGNNPSLGTEKLNSNTVSIFPNPTSDILTIESEHYIENVWIYDQMGREVLKTTISSIDVSGLDQGVYLVKTSIEGQIISKQFIKL